MSDVIGLQEVKLVVEDFEEEYGGDWETLKDKVEGIGKTDEKEAARELLRYGYYTTATAKVHLVLKDEIVIGKKAFMGSTNL